MWVNSWVGTGSGGSGGGNNGGGGGGGSTGGNSVTLSVQPNGNPYTLAYQAGNGQWTSLTPNGAHAYRIDLGNETAYGVAVHCQAQDGRKVVFIYNATLAELSNLTVKCPSASGQSGVPFTLNINASNTGAQAGDVVMVYQKGVMLNRATIGNPASVPVDVYVPAGAADFLITVARNVQGQPPEILAAQAVRNVTVSNSGSFNLTLQAPLGTRSVSVTNIPQGYSGTPEVYFFGFQHNASGLVGAGSSYRQVSGAISGDFYILAGMYFDELLKNRLILVKAWGSGDITGSLPAPWNGGSITVTGSPHPSFTGLTRTESSFRGVNLGLNDSTASLSFTIWLSKNRLAASNGQYMVPDLSQLLGYTPFQPSTPVSVTASAAFGSFPVSLMMTMGGDSDIPSSDLSGLDLTMAQAAGYYVVGAGATQIP